MAIDKTENKEDSEKSYQTTESTQAEPYSNIIREAKNFDLPQNVGGEVVDASGHGKPIGSERQNQANRLNAQRSTGPRTPNGKRRVTANPLKHGLTAKRLVLPNEDPMHFESFRAELWNDLNPIGAVEEVLTEGFVTDAWRLRRGPVFEAAIHRRDERERIVQDLRSKVAGQQTTDIFSAWAEKSNEELVKKAEALLNRKISKPVDQADLERWSQDLKNAENEADEPTLVATRIGRNYERELANLWRHEEALMRSMLRALHELERLQAMRAGHPVSIPAALDIDLNVSRAADKDLS